MQSAGSSAESSADAEDATASVSRRARPEHGRFPEFPADRITAVQEFLTELDGFARRRGGRHASARWLKTAAKIGTAAAGGIVQRRLALPPDAFRCLVVLGGPAGPDGEADNEIRSLAQAYLRAYADSFESAAGPLRRDLVWIRRCAGQPGEMAAAARAVDVISRRNRLDANILLDTGAGGADDLRLRDLYVPRALERHDRLRGKDPSVTMVVGEAGAGKTSLLWRLGEVFSARGDRPLLLKATDLVARSPGGDPAVTIDALRAALGQGPADRVPILLVDTVDLLLRSGSVPAVLRDLLDVATGTGTALLLTCRIREYAVFRSLGEEFDLHGLPLGPYEKDELTRAIEAHARHFPTGPDPEQVATRVLKAVARGLPLVEICQRPLTLRMLFELAQFDATDGQRSEIDTEIDVTDLYEGIPDSLPVSRTSSARCGRMRRVCLAPWLQLSCWSVMRCGCAATISWTGSWTPPMTWPAKGCWRG